MPMSHPHPAPTGGLDRGLPSGYPPTFIQFTHHSYAQMVRVLRADGSPLRSISRPTASSSFDERDLLVIEFSSRPGQHELGKLLPPSGGRECGLGWEEHRPAWP